MLVYATTSKDATIHTDSQNMVGGISTGVSTPPGGEGGPNEVHFVYMCFSFHMFPLCRRGTLQTPHKVV